MAELSELEQAERQLAQANATLEREEVALGTEKGRVQKARDDLAALDAKLLGLDPGDVKQLSKLDGERTGLRVALEVLERARLPRAQAAVDEALAAVEAARAARDAAEEEQLRGELYDVAAALAAAAGAFVAKLQELVADYAARGWELGQRRVAYRDPGWGRVAGYLRGNDLPEALREVGRIPAVREASLTDEDRRIRAEAAEEELARVRAANAARVAKLLEQRAADEETAARRRGGAGQAEPLSPPPPAGPTRETTWPDRAGTKE